MHTGTNSWVCLSVSKSERGTRGLAVKPYSALWSPAHTFKGVLEFVLAARVVLTSVNKWQLYINRVPFKSLDNSELLFNAKALPTLFIPEPSSAYQTHRVIALRQHLRLLFFIFLCDPLRGGFNAKVYTPSVHTCYPNWVFKGFWFLRGVQWCPQSTEAILFLLLVNLAREMHCNNIKTR